MIAGNGNMKKVSNIVLRRICFGDLGFMIYEIVLNFGFVFRFSYLDTRAGVNGRWSQWADKGFAELFRATFTYRNCINTKRKDRNGNE